MKIFDELLLDADWSTNAGMWMWLSCSSFFHQFFYTYRLTGVEESGPVKAIIA